MKNLTWYPNITSETALEKLCPAIPHITNLSLTEAQYDDKCDGLLRAIAANLHQLKYLDISNSEVDPKAIEYLLPTEDNALGGCPELVELPGKKRYTYYVHVSEDNVKVCTSLSLSYTQIACNSAMCIVCNYLCECISPDR